MKVKIEIEKSSLEFLIKDLNDSIKYNNKAINYYRELDTEFHFKLIEKITETKERNLKVLADLENGVFSE